MRLDQRQPLIGQDVFKSIGSKSSGVAIEDPKGDEAGPRNFDQAEILGRVAILTMRSRDLPSELTKADSSCVSL